MLTVHMTNIDPVYTCIWIMILVCNYVGKLSDHSGILKLRIPTCIVLSITACSERDDLFLPRVRSITLFHYTWL